MWSKWPCVTRIRSTLPSFSRSLYSAGVVGFVRIHGSITITLPLGVVSRNAAWPSQSSSVLPLWAKAAVAQSSRVKPAIRRERRVRIEGSPWDSTGDRRGGPAAHDPTRAMKAQAEGRRSRVCPIRGRRACAAVFPPKNPGKKALTHRRMVFVSYENNSSRGWPAAPAWWRASVPAWPAASAWPDAANWSPATGGCAVAGR